MAVPLKGTLCGLPDALSLMDKLAVRVPVAVGVKVTLTVHEAPAASVLGLIGQLLVWAKSLALVPVSPMLVMVRAPVPLLVSVTVWAALLVPTAWFAKLTLVGLRLTAGVGLTGPL